MHQYISLGAACNAATMIKNAGLRKASYPFDWLLNLETGLSTVADIIQDDFQKVTGADCYQVAYHPPVNKVVPAYKDYPTTFHIHSDPASDKEIHSEMARRFARFRDVLRSTDTLHFVYYRNLFACRDANPETTAKDAVDLMIAEAARFFALIEPTRQGKTFLLLVLESDVEDINEAEQAVRHVNLEDKRIFLGRAISRYDDDLDLKKRWQNEWIRLIVNHTHMPLWMQAKCQGKRAIRALRKSVKTTLKRHLTSKASQSEKPF